MEESNEIKELLVEIRDTQREHLTEYRKAARAALELQQQAVMRQEQMGKLYRRVLLASALLIVCIIIFLIYFMGRFR
jgi:cytochrome c-type biogenesis protein CcmH/NrfG